MRFYGIPLEERVVEIIKNMSYEEWILEEKGTKKGVDLKRGKGYDLSSLGCATSLQPARWKLYTKDLEGKV